MKKTIAHNQRLDARVMLPVVCHDKAGRGIVLASATFFGEMVEVLIKRASGGVSKSSVVNMHRGLYSRT
jgi:hypothetical protein